MSPRRFAFVGGGSGGDTYPVVAAAAAIAARAPGTETLFFGTPGGIEADLLAGSGHAPVLVDAVRLKRSTALKLPFVVCKGTRQAYLALRGFGAEALVSGGGFVSPPVVLAARLLGVPVVLLEPNAAAGRANIALARLARLVVTAYPEAAADFPDPGRVECLGMPLRFAADPARRAARRARDPSRLVLGLMGGSLGARALNEAAAALYPRFAAADGLRLIHVSGRRDHAAMRAAFEAAGAPGAVDLREYQADMPALYDECDVMIGRGGAMTCAEFVEFQVPALMIPRPGATRDHTWRNTAPLVAAGGCEAMRQADFSADALWARVEAWAADPETLARMRESYAALRRPGAADRVAARVLALAESRRAAAA